MTFLAIDQGTTSTRAYLADATSPGRIVHSVTHQQATPAPGHVEQDAAELLANVQACLAAARASGPITAIGLANQGESCMGWDAWTGEPVGPVISWQDDRTAVLLDQMGADAVALVRARAGLPLDPYFSASKLALIARLPAARALHAKGRLRLGTTDAYFRDRLAGQFATDPTTASRTALMALATCTWDPDLCALFDVPMDCLPPIGPTSGALGTIDGIPLTASVVDQQAALFGHGCHTAGDAKITLGTGAFALALGGSTLPMPDAGVLPTIAWQLGDAAPNYALDGGVYAAASAVNWARGLGLFDSYAQINSFGMAPAMTRGIAFVPALAGLACPHWDRSARGAWMGLDLATSRADLMQALLEGIAFRLAEVITAMDAAQAVGPRIAVDGGLSANPYLCQFLADVLSREIAISAETELTARGTAALAAHGCGIILPLAPPGRVVRPGKHDPSLIKRFAAARDAVQRYGRSAS